MTFTPLQIKRAAEIVDHLSMKSHKTVVTYLSNYFDIEPHHAVYLDELASDYLATQYALNN